MYLELAIKPSHYFNIHRVYLNTFFTEIIGAENWKKSHETFCKAKLGC